MVVSRIIAPVPTESVEQQALFRWAAYQYGAHPELALLYHVPNGGGRSRAEAGRFKGEGVKAGVPDLCLPVARGPYHGLYIELKRLEGGRLHPEQKRWLEALAGQGYAAVVCKGWEEAVAQILGYLGMKQPWGGDDRGKASEVANDGPGDGA